MIELFRELPREPVARFRARLTRFTICRSFGDLRTSTCPGAGARIPPRLCHTLKVAYDSRLMYEAALPFWIWSPPIHGQT